MLLDLPDAPRDPSQPDPFAPGARLAVRIDPSTGSVRASAADAGADGNASPPFLLEGRFEETVGSVLVVRPPPPAGAGAAAAAEGGDEERRTRPRREGNGAAADEAPPPAASASAAAVVVATVESRIVRAPP